MFYKSKTQLFKQTNILNSYQQPEKKLVFKIGKHIEIHKKI